MQYMRSKIVFIRFSVSVTNPFSPANTAIGAHTLSCELTTVSTHSAIGAFPFHLTTGNKPFLP